MGAIKWPRGQNGWTKARPIHPGVTQAVWKKGKRSLIVTQRPSGSCGIQVGQVKGKAGSKALFGNVQAKSADSLAFTKILTEDFMKHGAFAARKSAKNGKNSGQLVFLHAGAKVPFRKNFNGVNYSRSSTWTTRLAARSAAQQHKEVGRKTRVYTFKHRLGKYANPRSQQRGDDWYIPEVFVVYTEDKKAAKKSGKKNSLGRRRKFDGKFFMHEATGTKFAMDKMAETFRGRGRKARVVKVAGGYAVYSRILNGMK